MNDAWVREFSHAAGYMMMMETSLDAYDGQQQEGHG
jgi:hypothetical protein